MTTNDIRNITPIYTGGGIYILYGQLTNGNYFIASDEMYDVRFLNANPEDTDEYGDAVSDSVKWQEAHLVRDICDPGECLEFWETAIRWIIANKPDGNYSEYEMEMDLDEIESLKNTKDWR